MRKHFVSFIVLALGLAACGTANMDLGYDDASDATVTADSGSIGTDTSSSVDVATVAPDNGAPQGADVEQHPQPTGCTDVDKDGVCSTAQKADCNDNDSTINPNLPEACGTNGLGDGKDNNCNGTIDEGCTAPAATATIKITYPNNQSRTLNVQFWSDKSQLGGWWDGSISSVTNLLAGDLGEILPTDCGLRINVTETASSWLCMGNGSTATLNPAAKIEIAWGDKTYTNADLSTWSAPGGTAQGCSALLRVKKTGVCAL